MDEIIGFLVAHWALSSLFVALLSFCVIVEVLYNNNDNKISPQLAVDFINHKNAVVVDIRTEEMFHSRHIIDAIHIPQNQIVENSKKLQKYTKRPIIVVDAVGKVPAKIIAKLQEQGFQQVLQLSGGMHEWVAGGLPTTSSKGKHS